ncbi:cellulose binding domain-containing protein [Micromonospora sp. DT48]|uniref:cellulose binding domain-containing protein n=1 Tax=unclassified Micromonospora TaxID=2617518 RepID=UPI0012BD0175|nr:cellulose binding domain-containing protein [Micromonospora sp. CP22]MTK04582.1 endoglucanase [Micromonospora sp. CP22]
MLRTFGVALTVATLTAGALVTAAAAADSPAAPPLAPLWTPIPSPPSSPSLTPSPTPPNISSPSPTVACPPALPISGQVSDVTATTITISYSLIFNGPPCGYDLPITVHFFTSRDDAEKWRDPAAETVTGMERYGKVTVDGLTPDTEYWFRFSDVEDRRDPYIGGPVRTQSSTGCEATAAIDASWATGFVATVTVRNTGSEPLDGWQVRWRWSGDQQVQTVWGGVLDGAGPDVTVRNAPYNGTVAPDGTTTFGLLVVGVVPTGIAMTCG